MSRNTLSVVLKLGVAAGILYYIFTIVPLSEVVAAIAHVDLAYIGLACFLLIFERLVAGIRTKILGDRLKLRVSLAKVCEISLVSTFYGLFVPGELGGAAARWYRLSEPTGRRAQAMAVVGYDRVIDTAGLGVVGLVLWNWDSARVTSFPGGLVFAGFSIAMLLAIGISLNQWAAAWALRVMGREGWPRPVALVGDKLRKLIESIQVFRRLGAGAVFAVGVTTIARHLLATAIKYCFVLSIGAELSFATMGWIASLVGILMMIPITFSGLGVREGAMVYLMAPYGVSGSAAVSISFLSLIMQTAIGGVGGLFEVKNWLRGSARREAPASKSEGA